LGVLQGLGLFVAVLAAFVFAMRWGHTPQDARAISFTALVAGNLALIWANRSVSRTVLETRRTRNTALWLVTLATVTTLLVILYVPSVRGVFQFSILHPNDLLVAFGLGSVSITWFEVLKLIRRRTDDRVPGPQNQRYVPNLKRVAVLATGWIFVVAGIAGLILPVLQGILFLLIGLVILSKEYCWAGRLVEHIRSRFPKADKWLARARSRGTRILGGNAKSKGTP
jgi:hypothetical protein